MKAFNADRSSLPWLPLSLPGRSFLFTGPTQRQRQSFKELPRNARPSKGEESIAKNVLPHYIWALSDLLVHRPPLTTRPPSGRQGWHRVLHAMHIKPCKLLGGAKLQLDTTVYHGLLDVGLILPMSPAALQTLEPL